MTTTTEFTAEQAHAAVARGAAWLDKKCPDWVKEIDLSELDLANAKFCVLGQTAACLIPDATDVSDYEDVVNHVAPVAQHAWATRLGFNVPQEKRWEGGTAYEMLTIAWSEYIRQRLESAS